MKLGLAAALLLLPVAAGAAEVVHPVKIARAESAGTIFSRADAVTDKHGARDVVAMMSSDRKFESGMYKAGPSKVEMRDRDYGVDEFMLFLSGSVTLTSLDGTKTVLKPGDAVTIPAEWRGTWETPGYTKYYVIYSRAGKLD